MEKQSTIEVPEQAAVIGASLLKKNAKMYYARNMTTSADILHARARELCENTDVAWTELDEVELE